VISYLLLTIPSAIALLSLAKDWKAHSSHWRRGGVLIGVVAVLVLGVLNLHGTNKQHEADKRSLRSENDTLNRKIDVLQGEVRDSREQTKALGEVSAQNLSHLTDRVVDLQTKIETADLRKEADGLRRELQNTQKAMTPAPKAHLVINVGAEPGTIASVDTSTISLQIAKDHLKVPVNFVNPTEADAIDGYTAAVFCDACQLAQELPGWVRIDGAPDRQRNSDFGRILSKTATQTYVFDLIVPPAFTSIQMGFTYRCKTCIVEKWKRVTVNIVR
jgi:outer membrane murein-binding lipoprotein Lpp